MHRKAATPVDWAVGSVFFILLVAFTFYYANYISSPSAPYEVVLKNAGSEVAEKVMSNVTWVLKKVPVVIASAGETDYPAEIYFRLPASAYPSTLAITDSRGNPFPRFFQNDRVAWTAPLSQGKNKFYLLYSEDVNLAAYNYQTDVSVEGTRVNNTDISAQFAAGGESSLIFRGQEFFSGSGMSLGTSALPVITNNTAYSDINYTNGVSARIYSNASKVSIYSNHTFDAVVRLSPNFTKYYADSGVFNFGAANYSGVTDFVDAYNETGIAVIGRQMNFSVYDMGTYREIDIYNATSFELYMHSGNYSYALPEANVYLNPPETILGITYETKGVSSDLFSLLAATPVSELKSGMDISGVGFRVLFNSTENYAEIPSDRGVLVINHPISILNRFGVIERSYIGVAVWKAAN